MDEDQGLCDAERISEYLCVPDCFKTDALEIILGLSESLEEDMSVAFAYHSDVLYARIFDGEKYVFPLPFMLSEDANAKESCISLAEYAKREMIPLIITDVPRDELSFLCDLFPHVDAYSYEDDEDSFFVKVNNECDMLDSVPRIELDGIVLDEILESDKEIYAELCRDRELNRYWGYDVYSDNPDGDADFYLDVARREFDDGVAITLAIREMGEFVGEATIYGFDYLGSASFAVRVLRRFHSKGIGSRATNALVKIAKSIGLTELTTAILNENEKSIKMTSKYLDIKNRTESKTIFTLLLI